MSKTKGPFATVEAEKVRGRSSLIVAIVTVSGAIVAATIGFFGLRGAAEIPVSYTQTAEAKLTTIAGIVITLPPSETPLPTNSPLHTFVPSTPTFTQPPLLTDTVLPTSIPTIAYTSLTPTPQICKPFDFYLERDPELKAALGVPRTTPSTDIGYSYQEFEHGHMFWEGGGLPEDFTITVLFPREGIEPYGLWRQYIDPWHEGTPWITTEIPPPRSGLVQPIRGFGGVWLNNEKIRNQLRWGIMDEISIRVISHGFDHGMMLCISYSNNYLVNPEQYLGATYALVQTAPQIGYWRRLDK